LQLPLIAPPAPLGRGETVLVVAQDEAARERTEDALAALGFEPAGYAPSAAVAGGPQGMEGLGEHAELLVWLDSPGEAGAPESLLAALRETDPGRPLVRCTGAAAANGDAVITQEAGVVTIAGPCDGAALRQAVKMAAGLSDAAPARPAGDSEVDVDEEGKQP
jgi:FixJ family two-component response regulator